LGEIPLIKYEHKPIEKKWQDIWDEKGCFVAPQDFTRPKFYALVEFPYPSGQGLHVGHPRSYTALDIVARKKRMQGFNVLYPMGWDAFGLPTENFAIKNHIHPAEVTKKNIERFKAQLKALGLSFDWSREVNTTDPNYYKWTQWIFLQLFKRGLAYKKEMNVNWCTSCKCVLANEEVVNGVCERCGSEVVHKTKSQWMLKITEYAQRLIDDLDDLDYIERVKIQQKNWIGRSTGAEVDFKTTEGDILTIFTTRPDTLFGATYMVISPEHPMVEAWSDKLKNIDAVRAYREEAARKSDFERTELNKDKTGVQLDGVAAINPVNGREIPIFVSDYVLMGYGTGAIMAVPAHDSRDWEFAKKFGCEIIEVVSGGEDVQKAAFTAKDETGIMVNSDFLDGKTVKDAIPVMIQWLEEKGIGRAKVQYKLRDWVFSRQRYWGEPIPLIWCDQCGWVPVPEEQLPLTLPNVESYEPTANGESPLAKMTDWVNTTCPHCGAPAKRETDTMPQWAGSSWYFLRYMDPHNENAIASKEALAYWSPIDWYNGGMEHTTLHLLYSRFWHKFLYDIGVVPTKEPYAKRTSHGMILGENGEKMSKSRGNVVNPDEIVETYGADTMRLYEMFIGDFEKAAPWSPKSIKGCRRFLERVWNLLNQVQQGDAYSPQHEVLMHRTIKKVGEDIENLKANTAIAALMTMVNAFYEKGINRAEYKTLLTLVNPFAPHITEELWSQLGETSILSLQAWPAYDDAKTIEDSVEIGVQVNGKLRATIQLPVDCEQQLAIDTALADEKIKKLVEGKNIIKTIVVKNKIVNLVVK
jgi:leucyl-tRNA synthetase